MNGRKLKEVLDEAGLYIDRTDARHILEKVTRRTHAQIIANPEDVLTDREASLFEALMVRRLAGEPLAYLLGTAWFCGAEFRVNRSVLIPRPETEVLVDAAFDFIQKHKVQSVLDLGTGSGIIAITLAKRCPTIQIIAVDISADALDIARENALRHVVRIEFLMGDWYAPLRGREVGLILANPPYVREGDPHLQQDGLPFEPQLALTDGVPGGDGTSCVRHIIREADVHLVSGGALLIEHGFDQGEIVQDMMKKYGFSEIRAWKDAAGIPRVTGGIFRRTE